MKLENLKLEKITFENCVTKKDENKEKTNSIKIKYDNENLFLEFYNVESFGLQKREESFFYFPVIFKNDNENHKDFINDFQKLCEFLKNEVNIKRLFPKRVGGRSYKKFSPLKSKNETIIFENWFQSKK